MVEKNSLNRLIRCVCGKKIGPDPRNFNQRVSLGRNDLLIRTFPNKVTVLKGVSIGSGSVVGIGSVVSTNITDNSIAVGVPAKVVKKDIVWDRSSFNTTHLDGISNISEV